MRKRAKLGSDAQILEATLAKLRAAEADVRLLRDKIERMERQRQVAIGVLGMEIMDERLNLVELRGRG